MRGPRIVSVMLIVAVVATALGVAAMGQATAQEQSSRAGERAEKVPPRHVPEVRAMLSNLTVDKPRMHKNMAVFPIRWDGKQVAGNWVTMDEAVSAGELTISEKGRASVPVVAVTNGGDRTILLMSGEIVKGGKQTRVIRKDTIVEARQTVDLPVFCVEQSRWAGGGKFKNSTNMAPAAITGAMKRGADQGEVWREVRRKSKQVDKKSATESLDEVLDSDEVKKEHGEAHKNLGKFSPPSTVGLVFADVRTGRVVGVELFGNRALFAALQAKLIEGYTTDLVVGQGVWRKDDAREVTQKDVVRFLQKAMGGTSRYEDTPGSGRGVDLTAGTLRGKGVASGANMIHLSIQDLRPAPTPARPVVRDRPSPQRR
jgi:ARG and Rhodanese-Phosphatase-superfamily-associated Protein domain